MSKPGCCVSPRASRQSLTRSAACLAIVLFLAASLFAQLPTPVSRPVGPEHDNPLARELWFRNGRIVPGKPGAAAQFLRRAYQRKMQLRTAHLGRTGRAAMSAYSGTLTTVTPSTTSTTGYGGWVPLGPSPINSNASGSLEEQDYGPVTGRATSVVVDPGDPTGNTVYLGGAYGGLWKSTNAAASNPAAVTWTPLIDQQATLAVGSVAVQPSNSGPSNVILVGTGEADFSIDSYYGLGILRSADGGNTWNLITTAAYQYGSFSFSGLAFAKIAFSTDNPDLVVAATTGAGNDEGASSGGNTPGLYTSTDGGQTWALGQQGVAPGIGASSVIYDAASHKFLAFLQFDGYYTSSDGMNWTRLSNQPGTTLQNCQLGNNGMPVCYVFRGEMAVVPGREELYTWYVTIDQQGNIGDGGIYKTIDGGSSWKQVNDSGITNCGDGSGNGCGTEQGWFNLTLAAVPNGQGTDLYAGAVNLYKCSITASNALCGTKPFVNLTHVYGCTPLGSLAHVHPDQHGMSFLRLSASQVIMYFANDGGIYRALNGYALNSGTCGTTPNPFQNLNGTMGSMSEFVDFSDGSDAATLLGGTQDNGSPATDANYGTNWVSVNGGDGGFNAIDTSTGNWFTTNTDVSVQRCGAGINCLAQDFYPVVTNSTVGGDHGFFYTPFILDPQADSRMMVGTCRLWRGNSDGSGFAALSYNFDTSLTQSCSGNELQLIRSIAAGGPTSPNGSSVIYVGTEGGYAPTPGGGSQPVAGQIWVTNDADLGPFTWTNNFFGFGLAYPVSDIAVDPNDPTGNTAYATVMGFGSPHLLQTTNQGLAWNSLQGQIPDAPLDAVLIDPDDNNVIYVGTDVGVYTTHDLQNWTELGQLPNVPVLQLKMFESGGVKQLRAGTYGRGIWSYDIPYQIKVTTPKVYLLPGQSGTINGIIYGYNGFTSPVDIECPTTVSFGTCRGTTVTPMPSGTAFSLSVTAGTAFQTFTFALQGTGTDQNATLETSAPVSVTVTDYSFTFPWGNSVSVNQGITSTGLSLTTTSWLGFYEPITFSCSNLPADASCNFSPSAVLPAFTNGLSVSISAAADTPVGNYTVTVNATVPGEPSPKTGNIALSVGNAPDYSITATTPAGPITVGGSTTSQVTLSPVAGYTGSVIVTCTVQWPIVCSFGSSSAVTVTLSGAPVTETATLSFPTYNAGQQNAGSDWVSFSSGTGNSARVASVMLTVMDFAVTAHNSYAAAFAGQTAKYELFLNSVGGTFSNPVSFSCSGLPAGSNCSFSPSTVTPSGSPAIVVLSVSTAKTTAALHPPVPTTQAQLMLALLLPGIVVGFAGGVRKKRALFAVLLVLVLAAVILQPACGGGGSSYAPPPPPPSPPPPPPPSAPPPPVNYGFTVTAASGTVQHQLNLMLVVQPQ